MQRPGKNYAARFRAMGIHAIASTFLAAIAAFVVLHVWYPSPYDALSGGRELFLLLVCVDVVIGPLLTFVIFDSGKTWPHLRKDLTIIGLLQLAALGYGLHTVFVARPVALVFEVNLLRVVAANQVYLKELPDAPVEFRSLSLTGPRLLGTKKTKPEDVLKSVDLALRGYDIGHRPSCWMQYDGTIALKASRELSRLTNKYPGARTDIRARLQAMRINEAEARYLPVASRTDNWVAVLDTKGYPVGFMPYDGF